jgi:MFS family permease
VILLAGLVVSGTAQHMAQLLTGRLVQGLGSGAMNVAIFVCVAQAYSLTQRPRMFTYISTAWVLPSFVGPPASAWLTEHLSWHWVFLDLRCRWLDHRFLAAVPAVVAYPARRADYARLLLACRRWASEAATPRR